jgi:ribosomal protein S18 acetylase RimI-like enzyme
MRTMHIEVRSLSEDEWELLRQLRLTALAESPDAFTTSLEVASAWPERNWRAIASQRAIGFAGGEAVGMVGWDVTPSHWELISMWVAPNVRGTDVARLLVSFVVELAHPAPIELEVRSDNGRALRFYERVGFRRGDRPSSGPRNLRLYYASSD